MNPGNQLHGLALFYMLTGDPMALEACARNAEAQFAVWESMSGGDRANIGWTADTLSAYGAMYALTAERLWLDRALDLFKTNIEPLWERHGPHLHAANQIRGQGYARQDQAYCRAIRHLCELHHLTGDPRVMQLLEEACEREFPAHNFFEAPLYLAGLFAYVGWQTENPDHLARAASLFAESFPESRSPLVFMPDSARWHDEAANLMRVGLLPQFAWWRAGHSQTP